MLPTKTINTPPWAIIPLATGPVPEEQRIVQRQVRVVERRVVIQEGTGNEEACGVDQWRFIGVFVGQLLLQNGDRGAVGELNGEAIDLASGAEREHGVDNSVRIPADDDGAAPGGHDVDGCLSSHTGAAADDDDLLAVESCTHKSNPISLSRGRTTVIRGSHPHTFYWDM